MKTIVEILILMAKRCADLQFKTNKVVCGFPISSECLMCVVIVVGLAVRAAPLLFGRTLLCSGNFTGEFEFGFVLFSDPPGTAGSRKESTDAWRLLSIILTLALIHHTSYIIKYA